MGVSCKRSKNPRMAIWLVVWNMFYFSIYWECHHPNWLSHIFQDGKTTNQLSNRGKWPSTIINHRISDKPNYRWSSPTMQTYAGHHRTRWAILIHLGHLYSYETHNQSVSLYLNGIGILDFSRDSWLNMIKYDLSPLNHSQLKHILSQLTNFFFSALAEIRGVA